MGVSPGPWLQFTGSQTTKRPANMSLNHFAKRKAREKQNGGANRGQRTVSNTMTTNGSSFYL